ncbi:MAG: hypothetical protein OXD48_12640, partial [Litoreibacter sp.]|nr:hypothetical protein [Litoreibacter sp.]
MSDLFQPEVLLALLALGVAFATGPSVLLARGILRAGFAPHLARARGAGLASGIAGGAMLAVLACGASIGPEAAVAVAVLALLALLATMDILWRWLPLEWTLSLLALG